MKIDIKSVLIGALLVISIMLVIGLTPVRVKLDLHSHNQVGRYVPVYKENIGVVLIIDTTTGQRRGPGL
jgi:hypothetical protein